MGENHGKPGVVVVFAIGLPAWEALECKYGGGLQGVREGSHATIVLFIAGFPTRVLHYSSACVTGFCVTIIDKPFHFQTYRTET